jgi:tetratricopeptide (TPR) repeat protein
MSGDNPKARMLMEPAFVGRTSELEQLRQLLDSACNWMGGTVFVIGEAGAGKTRLVKEFLKIAEKKDVIILAGFCISNTPVPYFPFIEAFRHYSSANPEKAEASVLDRSGLIEWLKGPELAEVEQVGIKGWLRGPKHYRKLSETASLSPEIRKDMTHVAVARALMSISSRQPLILFIDDVHWADSASLSLLHYVSRAVGSLRVLIVATARLEELGSDSEGHPHPATETLRLMGREDLYTEMRLSNLDQTEVTRLAELMVEGTIDPRLVEKLARDSQGNPLFTVESIRMLLESGSLVQSSGAWFLSVDHLSMPTKVKEVILYRLGRLTPVQRRILDLASVIGERFDPGLLSQVLSQDRLNILETLNMIAHSSLLIQSDQSLYRFGHGKFREVLYDEISSPLKREYHSRIAEEIENSTKEASELSASDLAFHYVQAGNEEKAIRYSIAAGEDSLRRFSNTEAIKHFTYILKTLSEDPRFKKERALALEGLGDAFSAMGKFEEAARTFENLSSISESGEVRLRSLRKAMLASFWRGDLPHTLKLADEAEKDSAYDELEHAMVQMYRTKTNVFRGTTPAPSAIREFESCLQIFEKRNSLPCVADALLEIGTLYVTESNEEEALHFLRRSISLYEQIGNSRKQAEAYFWAGNAHFFCGHHQEAIGTFAKTIEIGEKIGEYNRMAWARLYSGLLYESLWELGKALADSLEGIGYAEKTDSYYIQSMIYANTARICAKLEDSKGLDEYRGKFEKSFADASRTASRLAQAVGVRTEAVLFAAYGEWGEANSHFEKCFELYQGAMAATMHVAMAKADYAWALKKQGRIADARMQIEEAKKLYQKLGCGLNVDRLEKLLSDTNA